jgi:hypothetical protein
VQIVNGYVCQTSCDVSAARAGHDPKNPHDDPMKAKQLAEQQALAEGRPIESRVWPDDARVIGFAVDATVFGGSLAGRSAPRTATPEPARIIDRLA